MAKKEAYPIVLTPDSGGYIVHIPDFGINTEGDSISDAMEMARDAIGIMGIDMEDDGIEIPEPFSVEVEIKDGDILTLVDIDFVKYRKKVDNRSVRKNVTIPYWLSVEADKANVNYSRVLQDALERILGVERNM